MNVITLTDEEMQGILGGTEMSQDQLLATSAIYAGFALGIAATAVASPLAVAAVVAFGFGAGFNLGASFW
jgi:hypothetical protein